MASGWANDDAVNEQINSTIEDAIARARGEIPRGESLDECEECGAHPASPSGSHSWRALMHSLSAGERVQTAYTGYNHKVAKDSQLR